MNEATITPGSFLIIGTELLPHPKIWLRKWQYVLSLFVPHRRRVPEMTPGTLPQGPRRQQSGELEQIE